MQSQKLVEGVLSAVVVILKRVHCIHVIVLSLPYISNEYAHYSINVKRQFSGSVIEYTCICALVFVAVLLLFCVEMEISNMVTQRLTENILHF